MSKSIRFTKAALESLKPGDKRLHFYDKSLPSLGLTVYPLSNRMREKGLPATKSFHVKCTLDGKTERIGIDGGKFPQMKIERARVEARRILNEIAEGVNPIKQKQEKRLKTEADGLTVKDAVDLFCQKKERRLSTGEKVPLKQRTIKDYRYSIEKLLGEDRYNGPMMAVTEPVIAKRVEERSKSSKVQASAGCRSLSSVWNWISRQKEYRGQLPPNPVKEYAQYNDGLHVAKPRSDRIEREELPEWFDHIEALPVVDREFFLWLLFTGNRVGEATGLQWQDIDWRRNVYRLTDPKNRRSVELPVPRYLATMLKARKEKEGQVFPVKAASRSHREDICEAMGKAWTCHDLRRTFAGIAESVCSYLTTKNLMNHHVSDITAQYAGISVDLRDELEKAERTILALADRKVDNVKNLKVVS